MEQACICWVKGYAFHGWMCIYTQDRDTTACSQKGATYNHNYHGAGWSVKCMHLTSCCVYPQDSGCTVCSQNDANATQRYRRTCSQNDASSTQHDRQPCSQKDANSTQHDRQPCSQKDANSTHHYRQPWRAGLGLIQRVVCNGEGHGDIAVR